MTGASCEAVDAEPVTTPEECAFAAYTLRDAQGDGTYTPKYADHRCTGIQGDCLGTYKRAGHESSGVYSTPPSRSFATGLSAAAARAFSSNMTTSQPANMCPPTLVGAVPAHSASVSASAKR